jgi:DNA-binding protein HU-beta
MKKKDLIDKVAEKAETSKAAATRVFDAIFDAASGAITEAVQAGENVSIPGFGKFRTKVRPARKGRNPQTGAEIDIPERTVVQFAAGKRLHEAVKGGGGSAKPASGRKPAGGARGGKSGGTGKGGDSRAK